MSFQAQKTQGSFAEVEEIPVEDGDKVEEEVSLD